MAELYFKDRLRRSNIKLSRWAYRTQKNWGGNYFCIFYSFELKLCRMVQLCIPRTRCFCDAIFPPKETLKSKKKHRTFWNTKFCHPAKFELKRINVQSNSYLVIVWVLYTHRVMCAVFDSKCTINWNINYLRANYLISCFFQVPAQWMEMEPLHRYRQQTCIFPKGLLNSFTFKWKKVTALNFPYVLTF